MLLERIRKVLDVHLRINQNGFRKLRSTAQHVLAIRRLFENIRKSQDEKCVAIFVDFSKAFDSISWDQMEAILYAYDIPKELVQAIMSLYRGAKAGVKCDNVPFNLEETFDLSVGVLQGDTLAPYLFVIVIDFILRNEYGVHICSRKCDRQPATYIIDLDFVDDIALFGSTISNAQKLILRLEKEALIVGLKLNLTKTEYILIGNWKNVTY
jgi:hypothetical protein